MKALQGERNILKTKEDHGKKKKRGALDILL